MRTRTVVLTSIAFAVALSSVLLFYYRDNFSTQLPAREAIGRGWAEGSLPLWNRSFGGGQPLAGNPNYLAFYPTGALQLILPLTVAFSLHFWLHLIAGGLAMSRLLQRLGGEASSSAGAVLWVTSGAVVSTTSFYNLVAWSALIPLILLATDRLCERPTAARTLQLGAAGGLAGLAPEPVMVAGTLVLLAALVYARVSRRVALSLAAAIGIAFTIASPQLLSYAEIAAEIERSRFGYSAATVLAASLQPWRLVELIAGPLWGIMTDFGPRGWGAVAPASPWPPLYLQLTLTPLTVAAIVAFQRGSRRWVITAAVLCFISLGSHNPINSLVVEHVDALRSFRFPEKLALHLTAALVIVVTRWIAAGNRNVALAATLTAAGGGATIAWLWMNGRSGVAIGAAAVWLMLALASLAWFRSARTVTATAMSLALLPLVAAIVSVPLDIRSAYDVGSSDARIRVVARGEMPAHPLMTSARQHYRAMAARGAAHFGSLGGLDYVLDRSPEGMYAAMSRLVNERARQSGAWNRWSAVMSARTLIDFTAPYPQPPAVAVAETLPSAWSPARAIPVGDVETAFLTIESGSFAPGRHAVVPHGIVASGQLQVRSRRASQDTVAFELSAPSGGLLITDETYFGAWTAADRHGTSLRTFPANVDRLAVVVPAGTTNVHLRFGRRRTAIAASWGVSWLLLAIAAASSFVRRSASTAPAR